MPGFLLNYTYGTHEEKILMQFSESILMEYCACRISAMFGKDAITSTEHELVRNSLSDAILKSANAILSYRHHGNIDKLLVDVGESVWFPMQCISRLIGHLDGIGSQDDVFTYIEDSPEKVFFEKHVNEMQYCLRKLWDSRDSWRNVDLFDPLNRIGKQLFYDAGMHITSLPDGRVWVSVP